MQKLNEIFLTFFYSGKVKKAPGSLASFLSVLLWLLIIKVFNNFEISQFTQNLVIWLSLIFCFFLAVYSAKFYTKNLSVIDHPSIVIDEVVGQIISLQISCYFIDHYFENFSLMIFHLMINFVLFRFFDIKKPSIIGVADKKFKNGFGIMFDDVLSGFFSAILSSLFLILILN
jgi:phosphatidylglycerophosphatase A